jgi:hypothetical protein
MKSIKFRVKARFFFLCTVSILTRVSSGALYNAYNDIVLLRIADSISKYGQPRENVKYRGE